MSNCLEVRAEIQTYLDHELEAEQAIAVLEHLKQCQECFSRAEFESLMKRMVKKVWELPLKRRGNAKTQKGL